MCAVKQKNEILGKENKEQNEDDESS